MKNKKGFTMIELLAVIVILGVLSTIAVGGVSSVLSNAKKEYYSSQEDNLLLAAQSYGQNNRNVLPKGIGQMKKITLEELKNNNYLTEDLKSYSKKKCDMKDSYVQIFKYSQKDYSYLAFLNCSPEYTSKEKIEEKTPTIDPPKFSPDSEDLRNADVKVTIHGREKVLGYSYILSYKSLVDGSKWREVKNSGSLNGNLKESVSFTIKLKDYVPGTVRLEVSATNNYGQTASLTASKKYNDTVGPDCVYLNEKDLYDEDDKDHYPWITQKGVNRKMKVQCDDKNGVGCAKEEYTKTFKEDADMGIITIKDKLGNTTSCKMSVYIDRTAPSLKITAYKRSSSGGMEKEMSDTIVADDTHRTVDFTAKTHRNTNNSWLNKTYYPNGVYYKISYSDGSRLHRRNWTYNTEGLKKNDSKVNTLKVTADEFIKGKTGNDNVYLSAEGYRLGKYSVSDEAGNTVTINITAPIDRTNPTTPKVTNPSNGNWVRTPFSLTLASDDTISGLDKFEYQYKNTNGKWNAYANSNKSPFVTPKITDDMNQKIYIRACDVAGNCTTDFSSSNTTIKLDGTPPTCTTTSTHSGWTNQNVTLTGTCSDSTSGCVRKTLTTKFDYETNSSYSPGTVEDVAGNTTICDSKKVQIDKTNPECTSNGGKSSWVNYSLTLTGTCTDTRGKANSGCTGNATKPFTSGNYNLTNQTPGTVYDQAGNSASCPANQTVKIDKTKPTCGSATNSNTTWKKGNKTIYQACSDTGGSNCVQTSYSKPYDSNTTKKTDTITIYDNANNSTNCPVNVYLDNTAPTCGTASGSSTSWTNSSRTINQYCNDSHSGCVKNYYSKTYSSGSHKKESVTIADNVGNTTSCTYNVYVDTVLPYTPWHDTSASKNQKFWGWTGDCGKAKLTRAAQCTYKVLMANAGASAIEREDNEDGSGHSYALWRNKCLNPKPYTDSPYGNGWSPWNRIADHNNVEAKYANCHVVATQSKAVDKAGNIGPIYTYIKRDCKSTSDCYSALISP